MVGSVGRVGVSGDPERIAQLARRVSSVAELVATEAAIYHGGGR